MKAIKNLTTLFLSSIFAAVSLTACFQTDNSTSDVPVVPEIPETPVAPYPETDTHVTASGYFTAGFKNNSTGFTEELSYDNIVITPLKEAEAKRLTSDDGGGSTWLVYAWATLNYRCKTADGSMKDLSELIVWPYRFSALSPSHLIVGCHSTITSNEQCPSNFNYLPSAGEINMLALFATGASQKALVVMPDYEGYGITADIPHPYCNRELTAEQVVEGAKAGLTYFENNVTQMKEGWTGCVIGYSQGGAVAAGFLRSCQQKNDNSLRLKGTVCGDGPYDPLATLKRYIEMDKLYMPVAPSLLLKGAVDTDPDMKALNCKYEDFVTEKFYATGIFDMIREKKLNTDDIQAALLEHSYEYGDKGGFIMRAQCEDGFLPYTQSNLIDGSGHKRNFELENGKGYNYCTVDQCLKPGVIAYFRDGTILGDVPEAKLKALEKSLAKNQLTADGFFPDRGFTFFHSIGDEVVPYCNFESVRNTWGVDKIAALTYQSNTTLHVGTGTAFFLIYCGDLVDEILNDNWKPREETVGWGPWAREE